MNKEHAYDVQGQTSNIETEEEKTIEAASDLNLGESIELTHGASMELAHNLNNKDGREAFLWEIRVLLCNPYVCAYEIVRSLPCIYRGAIQNEHPMPIYLIQLI